MRMQSKLVVFLRELIITTMAPCPASQEAVNRKPYTVNRLH